MDRQSVVTKINSDKKYIIFLCILGIFVVICLVTIIILVLTGTSKNISFGSAELTDKLSQYDISRALAIVSDADQEIKVFKASKLEPNKGNSALRLKYMISSMKDYFGSESLEGIIKYRYFLNLPLDLRLSIIALYEIEPELYSIDPMKMVGDWETRQLYSI